MTARIKTLIVAATAAAAAAFACIATHAADQNPITLKFPARVVGQTPDLIGNNMLPEENQPGSGVSHWLEYSGYTTMRFWWPLAAWPESAPAWKTNDNTLATFETARRKLRADPLKAIDWEKQEYRIAAANKGTPGSLQTLCPALAELCRLNIEALCPLTVGGWNSLSAKRFPFYLADSNTPDWNGRWNYWRGVYLNVFFLAKTYDVQRYQLFNEPDHKNGQPMTQDDFIERFQIGSDAIRAAIDDVNRLCGKKLRSIISGPVTAGLEVYRARTGRPDTRDVKRGWGETLMASRDTDFPGRTLTPCRRPLFDHYAFQNYTREPQEIATTGARVLNAMRSDCAPQTPPPLIVTETNVSTAANFLKTEDSLDTPAYYSAFGAIAAAYTKLGLREFYAFRLTQTDNMPGGKVKKNGMHVIDPKNPLKPILRTTKAAECARLFARNFSGLLDHTEDPCATTLPENLTTLAARDPRTGEARILLANTGPARRLRLDFSDWNFSANSHCTIAEVSERAHGAITTRTTLDATNTLALDIPATSNLVICITAKPPAEKYLRITFDKSATNAPGTRIARVWLDAPDGTPQRIVGHITLGTDAPTQWIALTAAEAQTSKVRVVSELVTNTPLPAYKSTFE